MNAVPELSGVDLARQALLAAREAAKKNGAQSKESKRRTGTSLRRDGREPLGPGAAISMMMTECGLVAPAAGGPRRQGASGIRDRDRPDDSYPAGCNAQ
ncbi:hypothetical protein ACFXHD_25080 [Streptomyces hydrogenans]|uniref:hypothetical protein n=1 Tax=Streptomyces hydrogenans TaxID=1873719 RepID=UPI0036D18B36